MALTRFVRTFQDLSDDGGFRFRFACDRCGSGYESRYLSSKATLLKTAVQAFQVFRWAGWGAQQAAEGLDRGLRGKERDAAYEAAVQEAMVQFKKCPRCSDWVCPEQCWNESLGVCEQCAPADREAASAAPSVPAPPQTGSAPAPSTTCPTCGEQTPPARFCHACGASLAPTCRSCGHPLAPGAKFCGECGARV